jgi:hypothetical protein
MNMPIPNRKRALELGASLIENDLHQMRRDAIRLQEIAGPTNRAQAITTSHEADLMKAVEWATAAATLRLMAELERK